jgi:hypothetical protein
MVNLYNGVGSNNSFFGRQSARGLKRTKKAVAERARLQLYVRSIAAAV